MKILVLEDRGSAAEHMVANLSTMGHKVVYASTILDAMDYCSEDFGCLIVDLNMNPDGLTDEEREASRVGLLAGWLWLRNYVYTQKPDMKRRTIICSEYVPQLQGSQFGQELSGVYLIPKQSGSSTAEQVINALDQIIRL